MVLKKEADGEAWEVYLIYSCQEAVGVATIKGEGTLQRLLYRDTYNVRSLDEVVYVIRIRKHSNTPTKSYARHWNVALLMQSD
jgi:hypothetical protein